MHFIVHPKPLPLKTKLCSFNSVYHLMAEPKHGNFLQTEHLLLSQWLLMLLLTAIIITAALQKIERKSPVVHVIPICFAIRIEQEKTACLLFSYLIYMKEWKWSSNRQWEYYYSLYNCDDNVIFLYFRLLSWIGK